MPRYDFRCPVCGHEEERTFSILEVPDIIELCPECEYATMKKVILPAAVSFKGSGFYKTDSRKTTHVKATSGGTQ